MGTPGPDVLRGGSGRDVICGRGGADRLLGLGGNDVLRGGTGDDDLNGGPGSDLLFDGPGDDVSVGGPGDDRVRGGEGDDDLGGGRGADLLQARDGERFRDRLSCGPGRDRVAADESDRVGADCEEAAQNDPPSNIALVPATVEENAAEGTEVGTLSATDPDAGDSHTFLLVPGPGSADNASFAVDGQTLVTAAVLDHEDDPALSIRVRATDEDGARVEKSLEVTVLDAFENAAPVAVDDTFTTDEDTTLELPVSGPGGPAANDTDADGHTLTVTEVSGATGGTASINGDSIDFAPTADACGPGTGSFDYTVSDGRGGSDAGHVRVEVTCVPDAPVAVDDVRTVVEDSPAAGLDVLANDTDADGDPLVIGSVTQPGHAQVAITGGGSGLTYRPAADYCNKPPGANPDTFTYSLTGGSTAAVRVFVECRDDAPTAVDDDPTVEEDSGPTTVDVTANDSNADGGPAIVEAVTQPAHGTVAITSGGANLTYQPDADYCNNPPGTTPDTFIYTLNGGSTATVSVTVTCAADAPVVTTSAGFVSYTEGDPATAIDAGLSVTDVDDTNLEGARVRISSNFDVGDDLVFVNQNGIAGVYNIGTGVLTLSGTATIADYQAALRSVRFATNSDDPSTQTRTVEFVVDDGGQSGSGARGVQVTAVDDLPVAADDSAAVDEDSPAVPIGVRANDTDVDGGPMDVVAASDPANGTVEIFGGGLSYQPDPNYCNDPPGTAQDTFTYTLNGGSTATVRVSVICIDDDPVAVDDSATVPVNATTSIDVLANDMNADGGPITVASVNQPANGTVVITNSGANVTYEPDPAYCNAPPGTAPDTFTYTLNGGSAATVSVTVPCDTPPVAGDDATTVAEDSGATTVSVLANDTNSDGGPMSIDSASDPANGTVVVTGGGTGLTYEPDPSYCNDPPGTTPDTFTYTLNGGSTATVTVTVTCVDDAPVAVNDSAAVAEDAAAAAIGVLTNDTDPDGGPMSIASTSDPAAGTAAITGGGSGLTYQPDPNYCNDPDPAPADTFTYTLNGGSTATVSVTVTCVDDAPVADDEAFDGASSAIGNTSFVVDDPTDGAPDPAGPQKTVAGDILEGDTDIDGPGPLTVEPGTYATNDGGSVTIEADGDFSYVSDPADGCNDTSDFFDYTLEGGSPDKTDTGRVTITIAECVWYVDASAPAGGDGQSDAPYNTLAPVNGVGDADGADDYLFLYGGGTFSTGLVLEGNQRLFGQPHGLTVAGTSLIAAGGTNPNIHNAAGTGVALANGVEIQRVNVGVTGASSLIGINGSAVTNATIGTNILIEGNSVGVNLNGQASGTITVGATINAGSGDPVAVQQRNGGAVTFTGNITSNSLNSAVEMLNNTGATITFTGVLDIDGTATAPAAAFSATGGGTIVASNPANDISNFTGVGVNLSGVALGNGGIVFSNVSSGGGGATNGIVLANVTGSGSLMVNGGTLTTSNRGVDIDGGGVDVTVNATLNPAGGRSVEVTNRTGGIVDFNGPVNEDTTGISLDNNDNSAVRFDGGITASTGANPAFTAVNGGTVVVTGSANALATTTGTALHVANTGIHGDGLTFRSINAGTVAGGPSNGIVLDNTGSGGLTVTGSGGACAATGDACTGGTIRSTTGDALSLMTTRNVSLTRMKIVNNLGNGIRGSGVTGFALVDSVVDNNADNDTIDEAGLHFTNLAGNASITRTLVANHLEDNARIINTAATLTQLDVTDSVFRDTDTVSPGNNGLLLQADGGSITADVLGSDFLRNRANGLQVVSNGSGSINVEVDDSVGQQSDFDDNNIGVNIGHNSSGTFSYSVRDLTIDGRNVTPGTGGSASPINLNLAASATSPMVGTVSGNTLTNSHSSTGPGIRTISNGVATMTVAITNNTISQVAAQGIQVHARDGSSTLNATITGNNVTLTNPASLDGVRVDSGASSDSPVDATHVCADIRSNTVSTIAGQSGIRVRQRFTVPTFTLEGYGGPATDDAAVAAYLSALNTSTPAPSADHGGSGFSTTADCPAP